MRLAVERERSNAKMRGDGPAIKVTHLRELFDRRDGGRSAGAGAAGATVEMSPQRHRHTLKYTHIPTLTNHTMA